MAPPDTARILKQFNLSEDDLLGEGSESFVYAVDEGHILRVVKPKSPAAVDRRHLQSFLSELAGHLPFKTPEIFEIAPDGSYTVERRLHGRPFNVMLRTAGDDARDKAFRNYVAAMDAFRDIDLSPEPYGHLLAADRLTGEDWRTFAARSLSRFRANNRLTIAKEVGDPYKLYDRAANMITELPDLPPRTLVHGDYFPGNVLLGPDLSVAAVLDFGAYTCVGDPILDLAVSYLTLELIEECTADDARYVRELVIDRHGPDIAPALRFYRAYLAFSMANPVNARPPYPRLYGWAIAMLKLLAEDRLPA